MKAAVRVFIYILPFLTWQISVEGEMQSRKLRTGVRSSRLPATKCTYGYGSESAYRGRTTEAHNRLSTEESLECQTTRGTGSQRTRLRDHWLELSFALSAQLLG